MELTPWPIVRAASCRGRATPSPPPPLLTEADGGRRQRSATSFLLLIKCTFLFPKEEVGVAGAAPTPSQTSSASFPTPPHGRCSSGLGETQAWGRLTWELQQVLVGFQEDSLRTGW